jgi:hypothetical protein
MAGDDVPEGDQPEIIPKPPSHPITTTLIITACIAVTVTTGFAWAELFGDYMRGAKTPLEAGMDKHGWKEIKEAQGPIDHYGQDFQDQGKPEKDEKAMVYTIKKNDLKLLDDTSSAGDAK